MHRKTKRKIRLKLWNKQKGLCHYCFKETKFPSENQKKQPKNLATLDHVIPKSRGGKDRKSNFVVSCAGCNRRKSDKENYSQFVFSTLVMALNKEIILN